MDISVDRLNHRLALQLPMELPLGLVFVTGRVAHIRDASKAGLGGEAGVGNGRSPRQQFELQQTGHRLRCEVAQNVVAGMKIIDGQTLRAGGHLVFDPHFADYYLLARDIEIVETFSPPVSSPPNVGILPNKNKKTATPILSDIQQRSADTDVQMAHLPPWVRKLAPLEVKEELSLSGNEKAQEEKELESKPDLSSNESLVAFLSAAIDEDQDVELTPAVLAQLGYVSRQSQVKEPKSANRTRTAAREMAPTPPTGSSQARGQAGSSSRTIQPASTAASSKQTSKTTLSTLLLIINMVLILVILGILIYWSL